MTNLQKQIETLNTEMSSQLPQEIFAAFAKSIEDLKKVGIENTCIKKGMKVPRFTLKSTDGTDVKSDDLLNKYDNIVLAFFRGIWCPYCNLELKALQARLNELKKNKSMLIAVSPQKPEHSIMMKNQNNLTINILFDENNKLAKQLGISFRLPETVVPYYEQLGIDLKEYNGNDENLLPVPAVFVINKNYEVIYSFVDVNYMNRIDIDELIKSL